MKALRIHAFGGASQADIEHAALGTPGGGQALVRVEAASVNPLDLKILGGSMQPVFPVTLPYTLGTDLAGVIEAVGPEVDRFKPGDRVVGGSRRRRGVPSRSLPCCPQARCAWFPLR